MSVWKDEREENEEKTAWEQQLEREQKERNLLEGSPIVSVYEIPERLDPVEAIWYYNVLDDRRDEVYAMHFARLKRMEDWLEIYVAAKEDTPSRELAYAKLAAMDLPLAGWIELHEARFHDERIVGMCNRRIEALAGNHFEIWRQAYDLAPFGSQIQITAMRKMRSQAQNLEEWQAIYDRSEIGSNNQILALQNILLKSRFEAMRRKNKSKDESRFLAHAASRGPKQWREEYSKNDFYSNASEEAVVSIYLSADLREAEGFKEEGAQKSSAPQKV